MLCAKEKLLPLLMQPLLTMKKEYTVFPYLLKEYMGQWYLVGSFSNGEKLYVFGLDRISELKIENKTFVYVSSIDPEKI